MSKSPGPAVCRLAMLAWNVVNEGYDASREEPVERTTLHRLALGYLLVTRFAHSSHVRAIWEMLGRENKFEEENCRQSYYGPIFYGIRERIEEGRRL